MEANKKGLALTKNEFRALLRFAANDEADPSRTGVQFEIDEKYCYARATNSRLCLQFRGPNEGMKPGEFFVIRKYIVDCKKELESKQVARLCFTKSGLTECIIEENSVKLLTLVAPSDVCSTQISFPNLSKALKIPPSDRVVAHCVALASEYLAPIAIAADAVEDPLIEWFHPEHTTELVMFRSGKGHTKMTGGVMQNITEESVREEQRKKDEAEKEKAEAGKLLPFDKNKKKGEGESSEEDEKDPKDDEDDEDDPSEN